HDPTLLPHGRQLAAERRGDGGATLRRHDDVVASGDVGATEDRFRRIRFGDEDALLRPRDRRREKEEEHRDSSPHQVCATFLGSGASSAPADRLDARRRASVTPTAYTRSATNTPCATSVSTVGKIPSVSRRGTPASGVRPTSPASCSSATPRPANTIA